MALRVDASDAIGTGHLMRCLTLAEALAGEGHSCRFILRDLPGALPGLVEARGHAVSLLPAPTPGEPTDADLAHGAWLGVTRARDAAETAAVLGEPVDWLVVDHYALAADWHRGLRPHARRLLAIDDLADRALDCDLLLDQNLQAAPDRYAGLLPAACEALIGPKYALLRPEFAALRAAPPPRDPGRVLVSFGGIDAPGATLMALEALALAGMDARPVDVVAGPRNPHLPAIRAWCAARAQATWHESADMAALMVRAGLAIGAAGATAWERCCLGLPTLLVTIAANQRPGAQALAEAGAALWAGDVDRTAHDLAAMLLTLERAPGLRDSLGTKAAALVDGLGVARVVRAMTTPAIALRPARAEDCDTVWQWRNDERTRRFIPDPAPILLESHRVWFAGVLSGERAVDLLIGEAAGQPVGVLRFDHAGPLATISIYLVPGRENRGEGRALLRAGHDWLAAHRPATEVIEALVLEGNAASHRAFQAAGYRPYASTWRCAIRRGENEARP